VSKAETKAGLPRSRGDGGDPKNDDAVTAGRFRAARRCRKDGWRVARMTFAGEQ